MFIVGNQAEEVKDPEYLAKTKHQRIWSWTMFIKCQDDKLTDLYIKRVTFKLHETYRDPIIHVGHKPFQVTRRAWGFFSVNAQIEFRPQVKRQPISIDYMLDFNEGTHWKEFALWIQKPEKLQTIRPGFLHR